MKAETRGSKNSSCINLNTTTMKPKKLTLPTIEKELQFLAAWKGLNISNGFHWYILTNDFKVRIN